MGLRQKLSPNKAQTSFISSKYVTVKGQPVKKSKGHSCSKRIFSYLAPTVDTREIVGVYIGARDEAAAGKLWESLPPVYRQCAVSVRGASRREAMPLAQPLVEKAYRIYGFLGSIWGSSTKQTASSSW